MSVFVGGLNPNEPKPEELKTTEPSPKGPGWPETSVTGSHPLTDAQTLGLIEGTTDEKK